MPRDAQDSALLMKWGRREQEAPRPERGRREMELPGRTPGTRGYPGPSSTFPRGVPLRPPLDRDALVRALVMVATSGGLAAALGGTGALEGLASRAGGLPAILPPSDVWMPSYMRRGRGIPA